MSSVGYPSNDITDNDIAAEIIQALVDAINQRPAGPPGWLTPEEESAIDDANKWLAAHGYR